MSGSRDQDLGNEQEAGFDDYINAGPNEKKHQFNTTLRESVIAYLRAASFHEEEPITEIVERAVIKELNRMMTERGNDYEIYPTHRVR